MESSKYTLDFEKPLQELCSQLDRLKKLSKESKVNVEGEIHAIEEKILDTKKNIYKRLIF